LVQTPGDSLVFEQVDNGGDVLGNLGEGIAIQAEVVTTELSTSVVSEDEWTYPPTAAM